MKISIVYSNPFNDVFIPVTAFTSFEVGKKKIISILGKPDNEKAGFAEWHLDFEEPEDSEESVIVDKLFKSYYGGCGECTHIAIKEIEDGQLKIFDFDLD